MFRDSAARRPGGLRAIAQRDGVGGLGRADPDVPVFTWGKRRV